MLRPPGRLALGLVFLIALSACAPRYQPREVLIPQTCEPLIRRAAEQGVDALSERERRELAFCQQQFLLRAEEEQAAYARSQAERERSAFLASLLYAAAVAVSVIVAER